MPKNPVAGACLLALAVGCTNDGEQGPLPIYRPDATSLFDAPWPTDARTRDDGTVDLSGFPNPYANELLDDYIGLGEQLVGYSNNGAVYLRFEEALDTGLLPDPEGSLEATSPLVLVDVDPESAYRGEVFPVTWELDGGEGWTYRPANQLAVAPLMGFPLRPSTTYALVVTTALAGRHDGFADVWDDGHPEHGMYAKLQAVLPDLGLETSDVAIATVFTTGDPVGELARMADYIRDDLDPAQLDQQLTRVESRVFYESFEGAYSGPLFQHGERPYASEGGGFRFEADGTPIIAEWEPIRIAVCTPKNLDEAPASGWPVVIYAHGTGGDYRSFCNEGSGLEVASNLGRVGIIGIGFDQPLHGTRGTDDTDTNTHSFNYFNPESARANFRQGALDILYLASSLTSGPVTFTTDEGHTLPIDPNRVFFMGHSQGGLTGALAAPWLGRYTNAAVFSGAGGGLSTTIVERKNPVDIAVLLHTFLYFDADEQLTVLHPVVSLVQHLVEVTDPLNYSPYWYAQQGPWDSAPMSILMTSGLNDEQTPHLGTEAMAAAARMPIVLPNANDPDAIALRGLAFQSSPASDNAVSWTGAPVTAGLTQWPNNDHYAIFENTNAAAMYRLFLQTAAAGDPQIDPTP